MLSDNPSRTGSSPAKTIFMRPAVPITRTQDTSYLQSNVGTHLRDAITLLLCTPSAVLDDPIAFISRYLVSIGSKIESSNPPPPQKLTGITTTITALPPWAAVGAASATTEGSDSQTEVGKAIYRKRWNPSLDAETWDGPLPPLPKPMTSEEVSELIKKNNARFGISSAKKVVAPETLISPVVVPSSTTTESAELEMSSNVVPSSNGTGDEAVLEVLNGEGVMEKTIGGGDDDASDVNGDESEVETGMDAVEKTVLVDAEQTGAAAGSSSDEEERPAEIPLESEDLHENHPEGDEYGGSSD